MDVDIFAEEQVVDISVCNCGQGFCPFHGTFHFPEPVEIADEYRRETKERGTNGGRRVVRKKLKGGDR
jgi:hypothetical protein